MKHNFKTLNTFGMKHIIKYLRQFKQWILFVVIGRYYTLDQIEGALNYGFMLAVWKHEAVERFDNKKIRKLMDKYISDLDKVNTILFPLP